MSYSFSWIPRIDFDNKQLNIQYFQRGSTTLCALLQMDKRPLFKSVINNVLNLDQNTKYIVIAYSSPEERAW